MSGSKHGVFALIISLSVAIITPVIAAVPTDASLRQLMKVTKTTDLAKQMMTLDDTMMSRMVQSSLSMVPQDEISTYQRQQLTAIITKYNKEIFSDDYLNKLNEQLIKDYIVTAKQHFTQQEVDAQVAFYSSAVGQSIIDKQPSMIQDYMTKTMPTVMQGSMEQVQKVLPRMQAEIAALNLED